MAPVGITARFPLGVYHGHASDGSPDPLPSPARLLSALVSAAHTGTTARSDGEMDARVTAALEWLEQHPPSGIRVPATMRAGVSSRRVFMHRRTGTVEKDKNKTETRTVSDGYALGGAVGWTWDDMPDEVRDVLDRLCEDTPCLGETDSLVVLRINDVEPNWILDTTATAFTPGGLRMQVAAPGRIAILEDLYARAHPGRAPAAADDRFRPASDAVRTFPTSEECEQSGTLPPSRTAMRTSRDRRGLTSWSSRPMTARGRRSFRSVAWVGAWLSIALSCPGSATAHPLSSRAATRRECRFPPIAWRSSTPPHRSWPSPR